MALIIYENEKDLLMKIYIDADGCPVVDLTINTAKKYGVECVILCDTSHRIERENARTIVVERGADSICTNLNKYQTSVRNGVYNVFQRCK